MKHTSAFVLGALLFGFLPAGAAGERGPLLLTLEKCVSIALEHNLALRVAALSRDAQEPEVRRAGAFFHPTAGLSVAAAREEEEDDDSETVEERKTLSAFVNQEIVTGGRVSLSGDFHRKEPEDRSREFESGLTVRVVQPLLRGGRVFVATRPIRDARLDLEIEEARLRAEILRVSAEAKTAYYELALARNLISVTEAAIARDRELIDASESLLRAGLVTVRDVFSAKVSMAKDTERLIRARSRAQSAEDGLLAVLGVPLGIETELADAEISFEPFPVELHEWIRRALEQRPEILEVRTRLTKSEINVRAARNFSLPQLDLNGSYTRSRSGSTPGAAWGIEEQEWSLEAVFSVPLGNVAARAQLSRAEIEHERLKAELAERKRLVEQEVRAAVIKLSGSRERVEALAEVVDQARELEIVAKARFALGVATNLDITEAQANILDAASDLLATIVDYNVGLAELEAAAATPIRILER